MLPYRPNRPCPLWTTSRAKQELDLHFLSRLGAGVSRWGGFLASTRERHDLAMLEKRGRQGDEVEARLLLIGWLS